MQKNCLWEKNRWTCFDLLPSPVLVLQLDDTVVYLNAAFSDLFGWTLEEIEGQSLDFIPNFLRDEADQHKQSLSRKQILYKLETKGLTKDGNVLDVVLDSTLLSNAEGQAVGQLMMLRDITREKREAQKIGPCSGFSKRSITSRAWMNY